jgi:hypothetical protein
MKKSKHPRFTERAGKASALRSKRSLVKKTLQFRQSCYLSMTLF